MIRHLAILFCLLCPLVLFSQSNQRLAFDGQLSGFLNYAPTQSLPLLLGGRYLPELNYTMPIDSIKKIDFLASGNIFGNIAASPFDSTHTSGDIRPYRLWARYTSKQFEVRLGLQKIDFGNARILRPLQWFNQVDPRDPLAITNGVYGALVRYYFPSNANIWGWVLYGNNDRKGYEFAPTERRQPEMGGRIQFPIPKGELGLTYHHRKADLSKLSPMIPLGTTSENRYAIDAKWDATVGIWFEGSLIHKAKEIGTYTTQTLLNAGTDYTFGLGKGLNLAVEHLIGTTDNKAFQFANTSNTTALLLSYPISFIDNISAVSTYSWKEKVASLFINYEHRFNKFAAYVICYYNPDIRATLIESEVEYNLTGPGVRIMAVYNH